MGLTRQVGGKTQKVMLVGDADCISNLGLGGHRGLKASNYTLITGGFYWFSDGEVPIDVRRPYGLDNDMSIEKTGAKVLRWIFVLLVPLFLAGGGVFTYMRRKGR